MAVAEVEASEVPLSVAYFRQAKPSPWDRKQYLQMETNMREDREGLRSPVGLRAVGEEEVHSW